MFLIKKTRKEFQLKIGRDGFVEIQVIRQSMLEQFFKVDKKSRYAVLLFFDKSDKMNNNYRKNFEKSKYKEYSRIITVDNNKINTILINDFSLLEEELNFIQLNIFEFKKGCPYDFTIEFS